MCWLFNRCRSCKYSKSVSWEFVILQFRSVQTSFHHSSFFVFVFV
jgi:hypothetical protein